MKKDKKNFFKSPEAIDIDTLELHTRLIGEKRTGSKLCEPERKKRRKSKKSKDKSTEVLVLEDTPPKQEKIVILDSPKNNEDIISSILRQYKSPTLTDDQDQSYNYSTNSSESVFGGIHSLTQKLRSAKNEINQVRLEPLLLSPYPTLSSSSSPLNNNYCGLPSNHHNQISIKVSYKDSPTFRISKDLPLKNTLIPIIKEYFSFKSSNDFTLKFDSLPVDFEKTAEQHLMDNNCVVFLGSPTTTTTTTTTQNITDQHDNNSNNSNDEEFTKKSLLPVEEKASDKIKLKINLPEGGKFQYHIAKNSTFEDMFQKISTKLKIPLNTLKIEFDGEKIKPTSTPDEFGMDDLDLVDVIIK
eukprot:TRINITY_DN3233_c0_g1_i2.p1 TRINITY_DN3233_c0_g1~~TRINITY_DN3233_c0_g1_i2.p1  ORF type:complete len:356 (-),score=68.82 TRINITY_DN3233_c0_g1_i2:105-1172(-)